MSERFRQPSSSILNLIFLTFATIVEGHPAPASKKTKAPAHSQPVVNVAAAHPQAAKEEAKKQKRKKDPNAPKKPMSAFFCFQMNRRAALKEEAPELNHKDIIKVGRTFWCTSSDLKRYLY